MSVEFPDGPSLSDFLPDARDGYTATAGDIRNPSITGKASEDNIIARLETIKDPEIPVNIYELGLIYDVIRHDNGNVDITMSLTAPGCPVAGEMPMQVAKAVAECEDVGQVSVTLVWEPAWSPERMTEDARMALDLTI